MKALPKLVNIIVRKAYTYAIFIFIIQNHGGIGSMGSPRNLLKDHKSRGAGI